MSRLRSAPAAKRPAAASRTSPAAGRGVYVQAPKSDIFVALLGVALGAILLGFLLMLLEWRKYDFALKAAMAPSAPRSIGSLADLSEKPENLSTMLL